MAAFVEHLKRENELVESGLELLEAYREDLKRGEAVAAADLRMAAYALQQILVDCHLSKETSLLYPALQEELDNREWVPATALGLGHEAEDHEAVKIFLLRFRLWIESHELSSSGETSANSGAALTLALALATQLSRFIDHVRHHIDRENHCLLNLADELLDSRRQTELLAQAKEFECDHGLEKLERPRMILHRLMVAKGLVSQGC